MTTQLTRVAEKAKADRKLRFTSLAHLLTPQFLAETWRMVNKKGAPGVDGETVEQYEANLEERIQDLYTRVRGKRYQAPPVRRVEIPKGDGTGRVRGLGIPTIEDRLLQAAVARILNAVYEPLFLECSYGYRPKRSAHDAVRQVRQHLVGHNVMQIYEADIRSYFDRVNHQWLRRMLHERISDSVLLRLIDKWLRAGVMDHGLKRQTESGVPQGGPISCVLSNVYLHYVLDLWFEKRVKPTCRGAAYLVRFVDDFVGCFQYKEDADRFGAQLLEDRKPETFEFLGFRHICGTDRQGNFAVIRLPRPKSCRRFLDHAKGWLKEHSHWKVRDQQQQLSAMLRGFYQYYALPHCGLKLLGIHGEVLRQWRRTLQRRSQRSKTHWSYLTKKDWFKLPTPRSLHPTV
jgi:RNA-directed DNA polymerase